MGSVIQELRAKLWRGADPFASLPRRLYQLDMQGWNSQHSYLAGGIEVIRPRIIVEVGVWKGGSTLFMANKLREASLDAAVIAVDTWLGAADHWSNDDLHDELNFEHGYPQLYYKFAANVTAANLRDFIVPLPLDSVNAREVVSARKIVADMIHIDAGHDYASVTQDLVQWWSVLRTGGLFVGDDYIGDGSAWPEVKRAIDDFLSTHPHTGFQATANKCAAYKL